MDIYETIDLIKTGLETGITDPGDLLYGVNVSVDPYEKLEEKLPLVLLEAEKTRFKNSEGGYVIGQTHQISVTCIDTAQKVGFSTFKPAVNNLMKNTIDKLLTLIDNQKILKLKPTEASHNEFNLASLKATGISFNIDADTRWKEL